MFWRKAEKKIIKIENLEKAGRIENADGQTDILRNEDILSVIKGRRSIRKYLDKEVEDEKIQKILEAARWAPSAGNTQDIELIVVKEGEKRQGLYKAAFGQGQVIQVPVLIAVFCGIPSSPIRSIFNPFGRSVADNTTVTVPVF